MAMTTRSHTTFRFLDLPPEVRLMVYERIQIRTRHIRIEALLDRNAEPEDDLGAFSLVLRIVPASILRVCRLVYNEASIVFESRKIEISRLPPQIILTTDRYRAFAHSHEGLWLQRYLDMIHDDPDTSEYDSRNQILCSHEPTFGETQDLPCIAEPACECYLLFRWLEQVRLHLHHHESQEAELQIAITNIHQVITEEFWLWNLLNELNDRNQEGSLLSRIYISPGIYLNGATNAQSSVFQQAALLQEIDDFIEAPDEGNERTCMKAGVALSGAAWKEEWEETK